MSMKKARGGQPTGKRGKFTFRTHQIFLFPIIPKDYLMNKIIHNWDELPVVLDTQMVAVVLNTTRDHVERMCKAGVLPAKKVSPRLWAIQKSNLQSFLDD